MLPRRLPLWDCDNVAHHPAHRGSQGSELRRLADLAIGEVDRWAAGRRTSPIPYDAKGWPSSHDRRRLGRRRLAAMPTVASNSPPTTATLSPHTGYTRAHWEAAADGLLAAAWRCATPGRALLDLPGPPSAVRACAPTAWRGTPVRSCWPRSAVAGAGGKDPHGLLERYADGLAAGTRTPGRDDAESWPLIATTTCRASPWWSPRPSRSGCG